MIRIINGNIFDGNENIICHQVNTFGIMGGGIALQVKNRFPKVFKEYELFCKNINNIDILGNVLYGQYDDGKFIANCFSQDGWQTDYSSLRNCLIKVKNECQRLKYTVAIPYKIGCGIANGDWDIVYKIIQEVFEETDIDCVIYRLV